MALPPTIPTSFVPRQSVGPSRPQYSGKNYFLIVSIGVLVIMVVASATLFAYTHYLTSVRDQEANQLVSAQKGISDQTVQDFVNLKNRLDGTEQILNKHVALSQFLDFLGSQTLQTVHYTSMTVTVADDRTAAINISGVAKSFNSLAAQSAQLAQNPKIKDAIFSGFQINPKDNTVNFALTFTIDPSLVIQQGANTDASSTSVGGVTSAVPVVPVLSPVTASSSSKASTKQAAASTTASSSATPKTP